MREVAPDAACAYLGDDFSDEDAFRAIPDEGAVVLVRPNFRATVASLWLRPPEELLQFLERWHRSVGD
jgi:trehalose-6-phosphatase